MRLKSPLLLSWSLFWILLSVAQAGTVEVRVGALGGFFRKQVMSIRERRFAYLVRQRYDLSCGSAALATLLRYYYGLKVTEEAIIKDILRHGDPEKIRSRGFSMLDLKLCAERYGFKAAGYKLSPDRLHLLHLPVIVLLDLNGYRHFVVLKGVRGNTVFLADPVYGHRTMSLSQFSRSWNRIFLAILGPERPLPWKLKALAVPKERIWALEQINIGQLILNQPFSIKP